MAAQIDIIPSKKIDKKKWDECIAASENAMIYARSFYLDCMADNWCGIVVNDYETVMPVCFRKKFRIKYCYDIPYVQQLGWFSKINFIDEEVLLKKLFSFCKYGDYNFNYKNNISLKKTVATNFIISLSQKHEDIQKRYATVLKNNLKLAAKENFFYKEEDIRKAIRSSETLYGKRFQQVSKNDFENFEKLCLLLEKNETALARKACNEKNELLASVLLLKDERRIYNIINNVTEAGRKLNANHFLYDNVLKEFSESNFIFDFEGSDIAGVKKFYEGFGAVDHPYFKIHFNHLSFPLNKLKP